MVSKENLDPIKGMLFLGCSFTWGQGLWYYSGLDTLRDAENKWGYNPGLYGEAHHRYRETLRFSRIVSNFYNTFDITHQKNGGANDKIVSFWRKCFNFNDKQRFVDAFEPGNFDEAFPLGYDEISTIVFQFTQWNRDIFEYNFNGEIIKVPISWNLTKEHKLRDKFEEYVISSGTSLAEVNDKVKADSIANVKQFLMDCEGNGIKTYVLSWPSDIVEEIVKNDDRWLLDRFIKIYYQDKYYWSIDSLTEEHPELLICNDYKYFEVPPNDCHPGLEANRAIALSIINFIENKKRDG